MAQLEAPAISGSQQRPLPPSSPRLSSPVHAYHPALSVTTQENTATIYDFLSLCGTALGRSTSTATKPDSGSQQLSSTQEFLQPQQKSLISAGSSTNSRPNGYAAGPPKSYNGSNEYNGGQYSCHAFGNGGFEPKENFSSKYGSASISFGPRGHVAPALPITKHWLQQASGEVFDGNKRLLREPSEEEDDEDEEQFEHIFSAKKDCRYQKEENSQVMDGRSQDKGITPRSKHSATEQRRRSKINDRFQMLRQLLPIADQKRDKASFLLEVIEYIQMLHEKVKKYEALEFRAQNQDQTKTKTVTWKRSSGQEDATLNPLQDFKEVPNANGYGRSQLSPLTVVSEDGITLSVPMCTTMQASALQGVLNLESKSIIAKSMPLNLSQAPSSMTPDQASNHLHQSIFPENRTFFTQFLRQEQSATKARDMSPEKTEAGHPHVPQSCQAEDQHFPCSRSTDNQNLSALMFRRSEKEIEGQDVASQVTESESIAGNCINKPSVELDGRNVPGCSEVSRIEQRTEKLPAEEQEAPVVLGGVINISSTYSQGLLDTLTRALQSSGVDMAQATISVKIDLGKPESFDSKQMLSLSTGISSLQNKQTTSTNELEPPPYKKLKVESV